MINLLRIVQTILSCSKCGNILETFFGSWILNQNPNFVGHLCGFLEIEELMKQNAKGPTESSSLFFKLDSIKVLMSDNLDSVGLIVLFLSHL